MRMTIEMIPAGLEKYVGLRFWIQDQFQRAEHMAFTFANECLTGADTPFGRMSRNGVLLCDETREYLYGGDFGMIKEAYRPGTHGVVEGYIQSLISPGMTDGEKVMALSQSMYFELVKRYPRTPVFLYGESDQETLLKGSGHCSCRGRLLSAMCQMIGIQARPVMMWTWRDPVKPERIMGGHTVVEAWIDGRWGFFDPQHHLYCMDGAGRFYSVDEIRRNPEVFTRMPEGVTRRMEPVGYGAEQGDLTLFEYYWHKNFDPRCPTQISRHDVNAPYTGGWFWATAEVREKQRRDVERHRAVLSTLAAKGQITDAVYQMGLDEFRQAFGIQDGELPSRGGGDFTGGVKKAQASATLAGAD
jgi:hypothetical protein